MSDPYDVVCIGAGAAGLFAATAAAERGRRVLLLEKNRRAGVKILASGGTRCNVTSTLPVRELGDQFGVRAERFLRHSLHHLPPEAVRDLLDHEGVPTEIQRWEKVFPSSGRAADVLTALLVRSERAGVELAADSPVVAVQPDDDGFAVRVKGETLSARRVIVTSGGVSYPKTGTTGDGYGWLEALGHSIVTPRPALAPLRCDLPWMKELAGISVEDAVVSALDARGRVAFSRRRPILFTHRGLSGPGPMDVSGWLNEPGQPRSLSIDWLPKVTSDELAAVLGDRYDGGQTVQGMLRDWIPRSVLASRLLAGLIGHADVPPFREVAQLRRTELEHLVKVFKRCSLPLSGDEGFDKAEVTAGGVTLSEVRPKTMESRLVPGLYVAGEILDVDGPIGGFNFQAAFSTGQIAGEHAAS